MSGNRKGFSLFEMLMVVAMIGVISTAAVPVAELMFIKSKENELEANLAQIRQAISLWKRDCRNNVVKQYEYRGLLKIPDANLYPPSLIVLMRPDTLPGGGRYDVLDVDGVTVRASFYPKPYLSNIPVDPFVGAATWKVHYASGTETGIFEGGTVVGGDPADHVGIFDVSPVDNTGNRRRGFVQAIDGTNYVDW
ncbi:MAG TPA: type II secretion system protein [Candidatus Rifleibacterium sp.]|nr:type II secretion system protein [Candidatus Rifleibacterium sp.]